MVKDTEANNDITQKEAIEWLKENKHKSFLGHGMADRHEMLVDMMRSIARGENDE